jgi:hypothetical protein
MTIILGRNSRRRLSMGVLGVLNTNTQWEVGLPPLIVKLELQWFLYETKIDSFPHSQFTRIQRPEKSVALLRRKIPGLLPCCDSDKTNKHKET